MSDSSNPIHLSLVERVLARRAELEASAADETTSRSTRLDIESALATLATMLSGDLDQLPDLVRRDLTRWLDSNKYLGVRAQPAVRPEPVPAPAAEPLAAQAIVQEIPPDVTGPMIFVGSRSASA